MSRYDDGYVDGGDDGKARAHSEIRAIAKSQGARLPLRLCALRDD